MIRRYYTGWVSQFWHPSDEELLVYIDGELKAKTARNVQKHLARCWSCRARRDEMDQLIGSFVKDRKRVLDSLCPGGSEAEARLEKQFRSRLKPLLSEGVPSPRLHPLFHQVIIRGHFPRVSWVAGFLAACLFLALFIPLNRVPSVSAHEVLQRIQASEIQKIRQVPKAVVYQKLRVTRRAAVPHREESVTWESWTDTHSQRFTQRVTDAPESSRSGGSLRGPTPSVLPLLAEVQEVFQANHLDQRQPLSAAAYGRWRNTVRSQQEDVIETSLLNGDKALAIRTAVEGPHDVKKIIEGELIVREQDWHAVEQRLKVQGKSEILDYALAEKAFDVVALTSLPPSLFADFVPPAVATAVSPKIAAPVVSPPSEADSLAVEIQAHYVLHQLKACLGKPLEVTRNAAGRVQVSGLVETQDEKRELLVALETVPAATKRIQTIEEAVKAEASMPSAPAELQASSEVLPPQQSMKAQTNRLPLQDQLEQYFSTAKSLQTEGKSESAKVALEIAELSNTIISLSKSVMAEAWALRRLAERYSGDRSAGLTPHSRLLLHNMVQDHLSSLWLQTEKVRQFLEPVLSFARSGEAASGDNIAEERPSSPLSQEMFWHHACVVLFDRADAARSLMQGLFANEELRIAPEEAARHLLRELMQWKTGFSELEARIARELAGDAPEKFSKRLPVQ